MDVLKSLATLMIPILPACIIIYIVTRYDDEPDGRTNWYPRIPLTTDPNEYTGEKNWYPNIPLARDPNKYTGETNWYCGWELPRNNDKYIEWGLPRDNDEPHVIYASGGQE